MDLDCAWVALTIDCLLWLGDRCGRLGGQAHDDLFAGADAAEDTAVVVASGADATVVAADERVVVLGSAHMRYAEALTHLDALDRRYAEHRFTNVGLELIENRLAQAGRYAPRAHLDNAAERIKRAPRRVDACDHLLGHRRVGAAH